MIDRTFKRADNEAMKIKQMVKTKNAVNFWRMYQNDADKYKTGINLMTTLSKSNGRKMHSRKLSPQFAMGKKSHVF